MPIYTEGKKMDGRGRGEVKEDDIYRKFGHFKIRTNFFGGQTDRPTDRQKDIVVHRLLHFQKTQKNTIPIGLFCIIYVD